MVGAILGFLVFNVPVIASNPFRSFMGDAGSTLLGFVVSALALTMVQTDRADVPPVIVPLVFAIPIFELFASTARRLLRGASPFDADNGHFHHVLLKAGLSVRAVFVLYFVSSGVLTVLGIWAHQYGIPEYLIFAGLVVSFITWMAFVHNVHRVVGLLPGIFRRLVPARPG
jgi:UDP-GlcNAc:undecaprenyl-phosphate GlcNAc-1-phosphate transferase